MKTFSLFFCGILSCALLFGCGDQSLTAVDEHRISSSEGEIDFNTQMMLLLAALEMHKIHVGAYPTTEQGLEALINAPEDLADPTTWRGPYIENDSVFLDPWNHKIQYSLDEEGVITLKSLGEDGFASADDLDALTMFPHWAKEMEKMANMPLPTIEMP